MCTNCTAASHLCNTGSTYPPVVEVEVAQEHAELSLVDGAAAVLVDLLEQKLHELQTVERVMMMNK